MSFTIVKPSFWKSDREIRDDSNALVGHYRLAGAWHTKAEGEAHGRKLRFGYKGWDNRYTQMTDESGNLLATIEPVGWWGVKYKLVSGGKEYGWTTNGWGTAFMIFDGEKEIARVRLGGYFKPGTIETHGAIEMKDLIPLILYGLYQYYVISSNAAATGSAASGAAVVTSSGS